MNINFKRIAPHASRIFDDDGDCPAAVYRQDDILNPGHPVYADVARRRPARFVGHPRPGPHPRTRA